jgi:inosose dehydratase
MHERKIAAAPISWGVSEVPGWGTQLPPERVLADAQRLGFRAMEAGPPGFLPSDAAAAGRLLDAHGLRCIGGFVTAVLHDRARREAELASVERQAAWLHDAGAELLVLAAATGRDGYEERAELTEAEWSTLFETLPLIDAIAAPKRLTVVVHPHVGTVIEQPQDIERLLAHSHVRLCLDTGHVYVGGGDPAAIARAAGRRVHHVHLKDADAELSAAVRERRLSYAAAVGQGLYRTLGDGAARISDVLTELRSVGYDGWYVLEQDVALKDANADPLPSIERSFMFVSARV